MFLLLLTIKFLNNKRSDSEVKMLVALSCPTLCDLMDEPTRFLSPWNSPGKSTGVVCHILLQGIFLTQGSNPGLLNWQTDSLLSEPPGKLQYEEWVGINRDFPVRTHKVINISSSHEFI